MYCVKYEKITKPYYGYIKPFDAVRDGETYSATYLLPSVIRGIEFYLKLEGKILRHKLKFNKSAAFNLGNFETCIVYNVKNKKHGRTIHTKYLLVNPIVILGFEKLEDAKKAVDKSIYLGRNEYMIFPTDNIEEMTDEEFDKLDGVETFEVDENNEDALYCGNDRYNDNKRMYVIIDRKEWE